MRANRQISRDEWADFKRLLELCFGNPLFRQGFMEEPESWLAGRQLNLHASAALEALRALETRCPAEGNPYLQMYEEIIREVHETYERAASPERFASPRFLAWHRRQVNRFRFQSMINRKIKGLFYLPVAFELSEGCSMGCPFCCLAAGKLKSVAPYTEENRELWRGVLGRTQELTGGIVDVGVCYFATEPFDNPEYEKFLTDFHEIFGRYPQTTTAAAVRDIPRMKAFLNLLGEKSLRQAGLRFSVISLEQMEEIHRAFSPRELEYVELLLNNPESVYAYSKSGRAVSLSETCGEKKFLDNASCICICGFVVNLAKRSIRLAAPHPPDAEHPLGMKVYEERTFTGVEDYARIWKEMTERWMAVSMPKDRPLYPEAGITWGRDGIRLVVRGDGISRRISLSEKEYRCFALVMEENLSLQELYGREGMTEFERQRFQWKLEVLYDGGCLDDTVR